MNEAEFRAYAAAEGYDEPEARIRPANEFFARHAHERDLLFLIHKGSYIVDYGDRKDVFGPGEMGYVAPGAEHTDQMGPDGADYLMAWR